jgi:hypothetical protein
MEDHTFSYSYLHKFLIYFHVFISEKLSFLNCILDGLLFFVYLTMITPFIYVWNQN